MKNLIKLVSTIFLCCILQHNVYAQSYNEAIYTNVDRAANVYYPYHRMDSVYSKSPKGYKPVYISHYGRHGSRYHSSDTYIKKAMLSLQKAKSLNLLNDEGLKLLHDVELINAAHDGMLGMLSPRGAKEHRDIAKRMYENFPNVFKKKHFIRCVTSPIPRCIMSMSNFTTELKNHNPKLDFSFTTGDRYFKYICNDLGYHKYSKLARKQSDKIRYAQCEYKKLYNKIFKNALVAEKVLGDPQKLIEEIYLCGAICGDLDFLNIDIFKYFDKKELAQQAMVQNARLYLMMGNSKDYGKEIGETTHNLIKDFVDKADSALNINTELAADLRFGHDTGIMPFLANIGVKGMSVQRDINEAAKHWFAFDMIPMGTNFQMIFYQNKNKDILVKMLYNEKELVLDKLAPYIGNYYKWKDLREYLMNIYNK